ncbi:hypothetical protein F2P81_026406 [Scophthalmus maximus]|uniref:Uncharacterized protein n=1 Tax=Scophthalmus maximus TaxID=52904 RepID=A0A6A4RPR3_SCOMX|nr:hypothetical protein F2P81_026406 [Scophthalmus maximus]
MAFWTSRLFQDPAEVPPSSLSTKLYLHIFIIAPATLSQIGAIIIPDGLGVRLSGIALAVVPAFLSPSRPCIFATGLRVALGSGLVKIPATLRLFWVVVVIICDAMFSL